MSRVVAVVGAGVSGLAAARVLAGEQVKVVVLEAADRCGGKILSGEFRGCPVDLGPDNFLTRDPSAARLCRQLGLGEDLLPPATSSASVLARGQLRPLPSGLILGIPTDLKALARSGIMSGPGLARAALDLVSPGAPIRASSVGLKAAENGTGAPDPEGAEWNAASILERRLGREVVERLVDPLLGGINAGNTDEQSLAVVAPQVAHMLVGKRSVVRALSLLISAAPGAATGEQPPPLFLGLRGGLSRMTEALVGDLTKRDGVTVRTAVRVTALRRAEGRFELETPDETVAADAVVLATPGYAAARLLVDSVPAAAAELGSVPYATVVLVTIAWRSGSVPRLPDGSGFLVPRCEGRLLTGCTIVSRKWPESAGPGEVVIRASMGRHRDERAASMPDSELVARVLKELGELVGASEPPLASMVQRWPRAFPQYLPGHLQKIERAKAALRTLPGLELAGAVLGGIGIPACVSSGERAAIKVLDSLSE